MPSCLHQEQEFPVRNALFLSGNVPSPLLQAFLLFQILPLFIVDATNYFGHIVNKQKDLYLALAEEMNEYYEQTSNHISVDKVEKLALYGLQEENSFHR